MKRVDTWGRALRSQHTVPTILLTFLAGIMMTHALVVLCLASPSGNQINIIAGRVIDDVTGRGIPGARIEAYKGRSLVSHGETDDHGTFRIEVLGVFRCGLYALPWKRSHAVSLIEYGPAVEELDLDGRTVANLTLRLFPVFSLILQGDIDLVDMDASPTSINFTVLDEFTKRPLDRGVFLNKYGNQSSFLGFNPNLVLVSCN